MAGYLDYQYYYYSDYQRTQPSETTDCIGYAYDSCSSKAEWVDGVTTLCLRNIPCRVDQARMTQELWRLGFGGTYDLLYLPRRSCGSCLGYGFVNFRLAEDAMRFAEVFHCYRFGDIASAKVGYAEPSRVQGFEANIHQFAEAIFNTKRGGNSGPVMSF
eukprot:TRINITY_DN7077_c0_g1_i1.p1 TRINITY_DN7077_c0_g1~~TRINITY_DN7077_c0_g1_i1.p1  ORF type:complete len:159 (-),score=26.72 TRINITY_DN7077_c0_g1_i1:411-887(-)